MENPEEVLHTLEEFSKSKPKDIPRELEEYLCFVAKTGDPVYQWATIKSLFREKMINVIADFYENCPSMEIPPCPNVDMFNYDGMKNFILEKLDTFAAAPFTVQRICELLTTPRKEYNRIDKYMRALEKNILVVSTTEPGGRRNTENGEGIVNGLESEHVPETSNSSNDINVEEMDDTPSWPRVIQNETVMFQSGASGDQDNARSASQAVQETVVTASKITEAACSSTQDSVITCRNTEDTYVSIEPVPSNACTRKENVEESDVSVTITAIPAGVQKRRNSVEPVVSSESTERTSDSSVVKDSDEKHPESRKEFLDQIDESQDTSSSDDAKDPDSSSNPDSDSKIEENAVDSDMGDKTSPLDFDEISSSPSTSSSQPDCVQDQVDREPPDFPQDEESNHAPSVYGRDDSIADTTKCSDLLPSTGNDFHSAIDAAVIAHETAAGDAEISSTDKLTTPEVESTEERHCEDEDEAEAKVDDESDSATETVSESKCDESQTVHSQEDDKQKVENVAEAVASEQLQVGDSAAAAIPMEVDEIGGEKAEEEVVKAEATSDSPL